ncbi:MAG: aminodeoxychorismate/anthranilate synthase component II [Deltaproteobacteria bacterium]|nr:aminodeoxychorismate/anthranilate synthase component II [Deltaproteobacteria bacterium]
MILLIDNYDSFTHNLHHYLSEFYSGSVVVKKNDETDVADVRKLNPKCLVISPGPGRPQASGNLLGILREFHEKIPIFGVCLGHQVVGILFGGKVDHAPSVMHGKTSWIEHDQKGIFQGIETPIEVMRYHSLCIQEDSLPSTLEISARASDGCVMAMRHVSLPIESVQFHPESILTKHGKKIIKSFIHNVASLRALKGRCNLKTEAVTVRKIFPQT